MEATRQYVVGFLFDADFERVVLIRKTHPPFQEGKLNGVGGKIENFESAIQCMIREFKEETGRHIETWKRYCVLKGMESDGSDFIVHFFSAVSDLLCIRSMTDEKVEITKIADIHYNKPLDNVRWLVPMAISMYFEAEINSSVYEYDVNEVGRR